MIRSLALAATAVAATLTLAAPAEAAPAASAEVNRSVVQAVPEAESAWTYVRSYYWESDCRNEGARLYAGRTIKEWKCDGSGLPWNDFDLWVVYR